jgi:hypothetical protein
MEYEIRHFFDYLEYESLEEHNISFHRPTKNDQDIFIAKLHTPLAFYVPKSEVFDMYQDPFSNNIINYLINTDLHPEMITFLENLDSLCVTTASEHAKEWFDKDLDIETLINYYNTLYDMSEDEVDIYLPIEIENAKDIATIMKYNTDESLILSIKIIGIEFYKQTFKWKLEFNSILDSDNMVADSDDSIESDTSSSSEEEIDFNNILIKDNIVNDTHTGSETRGVIQDTGSIDYGIIEDPVVNESMINELAETQSKEELVAPEKDLVAPEKDLVAPEKELVVPEKDLVAPEEELVAPEEELVAPEEEPLVTPEEEPLVAPEKDLVAPEEELVAPEEVPLVSKEIDLVNDSVYGFSNVDDTVTGIKTDISEIQNIIQNKRIQARKFSLNADRAKRASDTLSSKASDMHKEISLYENKLKAHSTT